AYPRSAETLCQGEWRDGEPHGGGGRAGGGVSALRPALPDRRHHAPRGKQRRSAHRRDQRTEADPGRNTRRHQSQGVDESERPARDKSGEGDSEARHRQSESPRAAGADGIAAESPRSAHTAGQINQIQPTQETDNITESNGGMIFIVSRVKAGNEHTHRTGWNSAVRWVPVGSGDCGLSRNNLFRPNAASQLTFG